MLAPLLDRIAALERARLADAGRIKSLESQLESLESRAARITRRRVCGLSSLRAAMTLEERLTEGARRVQEILDEDFLRFQSVLFQAYPDIDVDGYRRDGVFTGHCDHVGRRFVQQFHDALHAHDER